MRSLCRSPADAVEGPLNRKRALGVSRQLRTNHHASRQSSGKRMKINVKVNSVDRVLSGQRAMGADIVVRGIKSTLNRKRTSLAV